MTTNKDKTKKALKNENLSIFHWCSHSNFFLCNTVKFEGRKNRENLNFYLLYIFL